MERKLKKNKKLGFKQTTLKCVHFGVPAAQIGTSWDDFKMYPNQTHLDS